MLRHYLYGGYAPSFMYELLSHVRRSAIKPKILRLLAEPKTPTDLKKVLGVHRESVSRALLDLEEKGLVECITPDQPNYRYYQRTTKGEELLKKMEKSGIGKGNE